MSSNSKCGKCGKSSSFAENNIYGFCEECYGSLEYCLNCDEVPKSENNKFDLCDDCYNNLTKIQNDIKKVYKAKSLLYCLGRSQFVKDLEKELGKLLVEELRITENIPRARVINIKEDL